MPDGPDFSSMSDEQLQAHVQQLRAQKEAAPLPTADQFSSMSDDELREAVGRLRQAKLTPYIQEAQQAEAKAERTAPWSRERLMNPGVQHNYLMRKVFSVSQPIHDIEFGNAMGRFNRGEDTEGDLKLIAKRQLQEHLDAQRTGKEKLAGGAVAIPGQVAEIMAGSRLASGVGALGTELAGGAAMTPELAAAQRAARAAGGTMEVLGPPAVHPALRFAGNTAAQAALTPNLGLAAVVQQNTEAGRDPLDTRGVPAGMAKSMAEAAVLHGAGKFWSKALPTSSVAGGYAVAGLTGPISQQVTDLTTYGLGLNSRYGRLQDIAEGKYGEAASAALLETMTFAAMHSMHGQDGKPVLDQAKTVLDVYAKAGVPADTAAADLTKIHTRITQMRQRGMTEDRAGAMFRDIPTGPLRDYADRLAGLSLESPPVGQAGARQRGPGEIPAAEQAPPAERPVAESYTPPEPPKPPPEAPAEGWQGYQPLPLAKQPTVEEIQAAKQPQEGPQQPQGGPISPAPPTAGEARGRREATSDEQTLGQWMDERRGLSAENDASFAETMRRSGMSESEVQQALSGMHQRRADARAAAARSRDFRRQADEAAPEAAPPAATEPTRRLSGAEAVRRVFEQHFGASSGGRFDIEGRFGERELGLDVGMLDAGPVAHLTFGFEGTPWESQAKPGGALRPGTMGFAKKLQAFAVDLGRAGVRISWEAEPRRDALYKKILSRSGYEPDPSVTADSGDGPEYPYETWKPKVVVAPATGEAVYHITDYKKPAESAATALGILARKGSGPRPLETWDAGVGKGGGAGFEANFKPGHVGFEFDPQTFTGTLDRGSEGKPQGRGTSTDPLRYNPGLKRVIFRGRESDPNYGKLREMVAEINKERADPALMKEYGREPMEAVKLDLVGRKPGEAAWTGEERRKVAEPAKVPLPEAPLPRTTEDLQAELQQHGEALDAAALFERVAQTDNLTPQERHVLKERLGGRSIRDISKDPQLSGLKGDRAAAYLEKKALGKIAPGVKSVEELQAQEREGRKQRMTEAGAGVGREEAEQQGGGIDPRTVGTDVSDLAAMHEEMERNQAEEQRLLKEITDEYERLPGTDASRQAPVRREVESTLQRAAEDAEAARAGQGAPPGPAAPPAGPAEAPAAGPESAAHPPADAGGGPAGGDLVSRNLFGQPIPKRFASVPGVQQRLGQGDPNIPHSGGEWMAAADDLAADMGTTAKKIQPNIAEIGGKRYRVEFTDNDWRLTPEKAEPLKPEWRVPQRRRFERDAKDLGVSPADLHGAADDEIAKDKSTLLERQYEWNRVAAALDAHGKQWRTQAAREATGQELGRTEDFFPGQDDVAAELGLSEERVGEIARGKKPQPITMKEAYAKAYDQIASAQAAAAESQDKAAARQAGFAAGAVEDARALGHALAEEAVGQATPDELDRELHGLGDAAEPAGGSGDFNPGEFGEPGQPGAVVPKRGEPVSPLQQLAEEMAKNELPAGTLGAGASPLLLKAQEWATERFKKNVQTVADETAKLAGRMFPATTRLDRESGEATARFVAARTWAKYAAPDYIDRVMGPKATEQQRRAAGAVITEMHLRHTKQAYIQRANDLAAEARAAGGQKAVDLRNQELEARQIARDVKSVVGVPGSPLKTEADYQAGVQSPFVKDVIARWKAEFAPVINDLYRRGQGIDASDPIDSFTQIEDFPVNLKAVGPNDPSTPGTVATGGSRGNLTNPRQKTSVFANQRKGNAPAYDIDLGAMIENSLARGAEVAAKREMYDTLQKNGLAERGEPGLAGEGYERLPGVFRGPKPDLYVHAEAMPELRQALAPDKPFGRIPIITAALTKASLLSTVELAYHAKNQLTFLMKPGVRPTDLFNNAVGYLRGSPEVRARLTELARIGAMKPPGMEAGQLLPGKYRQFDPTYWSGKLLDGIGNVMRLTAADAFDRLAGNKPDLIYDAIARVTGVKPEAVNTETAKRDFINQLGQYEKRAQNKLVVLLRDTGIGPFATAGTNYYAQGIRGLTMNPGVHSESFAGQGMMRGETLLKTMAVLGSVALANYLAWGRVDGDDRTPAGAIKLGQQGDKTISYDMADIIGLKRGMRATGLLALTEGERRGDREGKVLDKAVDDAFLAAAHPAMGPPVQFGYTAKTGKDLTGRAVAPHAKAKESQTALNLEAALRQANPPTHALVGDATKQGQKETAAEKWNRLLGPFGVKFRPTPKKK